MYGEFLEFYEARINPDYLLNNTVYKNRMVFNRLNIFQLYEQSINFITERIVEKFVNEDMKVSDMEKIFFKVIGIFNPEEEERVKVTYKEKCTTVSKKKEYFDIVKKNGIYIHVKPYWHPINIYEAVCKCYEEFPWIKPYKVYFYEPTSKRWCKMMNDQIIGSMYVMKLKQTSKKNMSACSTAPINNLSLPEKTDSAKKHKTSHPKTPIRSGLTKWSA